MSETLLERNVKHHYLENNYNCAETMIQACNDTFKLDLPAFAYRMLSHIECFRALEAGCIQGMYAAPWWAVHLLCR